MSDSTSEDELTRLQRRLKELQAESDAILAEMQRVEAEEARIKAIAQQPRGGTLFLGADEA